MLTKLYLKVNVGSMPKQRLDFVDIPCSCCIQQLHQLCKWTNRSLKKKKKKTSRVRLKKKREPRLRPVQKGEVNTRELYHPQPWMPPVVYRDLGTVQNLNYFNTGEKYTLTLNALQKCTFLLKEYRGVLGAGFTISCAARKCSEFTGMCG